MTVLLVDFDETVGIQVDGRDFLKFSLFLVDSKVFMILVSHNILEDYRMRKINQTYFIVLIFWGTYA